MTRLLTTLEPAVPLLVTALVLFLIGALGSRWLEALRRRERSSVSLRAGAIAVFVLVALIALTFAAPLDSSERGQLIGILGVLASAAIALASTTLIGNVLAGVSLRTTRSFRVGDFLRVDTHFGRISERGWVHIELQTEDGDLTTLPNAYVAAHPHTVVRASGTVISAALSLGYDVPRDEIERYLLQAATTCGLTKPFVHLTELGDFAVTYRVAGVLEDVTQMLTRRSELRGAVFDALHGAGIEIVSPTFMNTRAFGKDDVFIAAASRTRRRSAKPAEEVMFNKAAGAAALEALREELAIAVAEQASADAERKGLKDAVPPELDERFQRLSAEVEGLRTAVERAEATLQPDKGRDKPQS